MADCDFSFGGRISITIDGTRYAPSDADISIDASNLEIAAMANQDGSACYTAKPKLFSADVKFRNPPGFIWNAAMLKCKIDATIVEETNGRTHLFTGARLTGMPQLNLSTGEVTGLKIEGAQYQVLVG